MAVDKRNYLQSVSQLMEGMQSQETKIVLNKIVFQSEQQRDDKPNANLEHLVHKYSDYSAKYQWEIGYEVSVENTHKLTFINHNSAIQRFKDSIQRFNSASAFSKVKRAKGNVLEEQKSADNRQHKGKQIRRAETVVESLEPPSTLIRNINYSQQWLEKELHIAILQTNPIESDEGGNLALNAERKRLQDIFFKTTRGLKIFFGVLTRDSLIRC
eukprot:160551_1